MFLPTSKLWLYCHYYYQLYNIIYTTEQWWHTPLILSLGRKRRVNLCEFKACLVYRQLVQGTIRAVTISKQTNKQTISMKRRRIKENQTQDISLIHGFSESGLPQQNSIAWGLKQQRLCPELWRLQGHGASVSGVCQESCGLQLLLPRHTGWLHTAEKRQGSLGLLLSGHRFHLWGPHLLHLIPT